MEQLKPLSPMQLEKDRGLEQDIRSLQNVLLELIHVLQDYIYLNVDTPSCKCMVRRNREDFFRVFKDDITSILNLLHKIRKYYCKKEYTDQHLASMIFLPMQQYKDYFSCNIQAIIKSVVRYRDHILKQANDCEFKDNHFLRGQCTFFNDMLVDISEFNDEIYRDKAVYFREMKKCKMISEDEELFVEKYRTKACRRSQLMAMEILYASQQIVSRHLYYNDMSPVSVAIFQLRQAIEIRMFEILGIKSIVEDDGVPKKITGNALFELPGLKDSVIFPVKFDNIKLIYSWTNIYVHMAICNNYWLLDFAQNYLKDFVFWQPIIKKSFLDTIKENIANYAGTEVKNVIMRDCVYATLVSDDDEFQQINCLIEKNGFITYLKQKDELELRAMESYIQRQLNIHDGDFSTQQ